MVDYEYKGYIITEMPDGYYTVADYEFSTFDEACAWIDEEIADADFADEYGSVITTVSDSEIHTYHIFYVPKGSDRGYDDFIQAHSEKEAQQLLQEQEGDIGYITDCYPID